VRATSGPRSTDVETDRLVVRLQRSAATVSPEEQPVSPPPLPDQSSAAPPPWPVDQRLPATGDSPVAAAPAAQPRGHRREGRLAGLAASLGDRLPSTLRGGRLALDRGAALGLGVVGLVAVVAAALIWWQGRPQAVAVPPVLAPAAPSATGPPSAPTLTGLPSTAGTPAPVPGSLSAPAPVPTPPAGTPSSPGAPVVVDVAGRVRNPGVVRLPPGSRVVDALRAAGGARRGTDLTSVNLARPLVDGEQVLVGKVQWAVPPVVTSPSGATAPAGVVDLNTATAEQLQELPEIGEVLAQRIIDWRTEHGRFSTIDELQEVSGIGPRTFDGLKDLVRV